jgi:5-(carboxyamino)imidazole ribonucleotide mutase
VRNAETKGVQVLIACAGMAAHLAGVVAAHTLLPVIGVPVNSGSLLGLDALLATVQMPPGIPVATVAIDGGRNAAVLAARIIALHEPEVRRALEEALAADKSRYDNP